MGLKSTPDYQLQKQLAAEDSQRDARDFVHKHKDLILGASVEEIDRAIEKIATALRELRVAKLDAQVEMHRALNAFKPEKKIGVSDGNRKS